MLAMTIVSIEAVGGYLPAQQPGHAMLATNIGRK